jgi:hypothetical protein
MKKGVVHVYIAVGMEHAPITLNFNLFSAGINLTDIKLQHVKDTCLVSV